MAKLITVTREQIKAFLKEWEKMASKDPVIQDMEKEIEKWEKQERLNQ